MFICLYMCVYTAHTHIYKINFQKNPSIPWYNAKEEMKISFLIG